MKKCVWLFALWGATLALANHNDPAYWRMVRKGVEAKIVLTVVDDLGSPVPDAAVHAIFSRTNDLEPFDGKTDAQGKCEFQHLTNGDRLEFFISKDGYYGSQIQFTLIKMGAEHKIENGRWQPWPLDSKLVLRRKRIPSSQLREGWLNVPATNVWIGIDMENLAFVKPYGNGKVADFEFRANWDGLPPPLSKYCDAELRFVTPLSGGYYSECVKESHYPLSYAVKGTDFSVKHVKIVDRDGGPHKGKAPFRDNAELITRTRCVLDENGNLVSSVFGSVFDFRVGPSFKGSPILFLGLIFNPIPNDTNLEPKNWP